jgi:hypothetical protein
LGQEIRRDHLDCVIADSGDFGEMIPEGNGPAVPDNDEPGITGEDRGQRNGKGQASDVGEEIDAPAERDAPADDLPPAHCIERVASNFVKDPDRIPAAARRTQAPERGQETVRHPPGLRKPT